MKRGIAVSLFFMLCLSSTVYAIGISPPELKIPFQSGTEKNITLNILNTGESPINATLGFGGKLAKYVKYHQEYFLIPPESIQTITATIQMPEKMEPGDQIIDFVAKEVPYGEASEGINVFGEIGGRIIIVVPYPTMYATITLQGKDSNLNEPVGLIVTVSNLGKYTIPHLLVSLHTEDLFEQTIDTWKKDVENIGPGQAKTTIVEFDRNKYAAGEYKAFAQGTYGTRETNEEELQFRIGQFFINITNQELFRYENNIVKIATYIESQWNQQIDNVFAILEIEDEKQQKIASLKTPAITVAPWEKTQLTAFWDRAEVQDGTYTAKVTVWYGEGTTTSSFPLDLTPIQQSSKGWNILLLIIVLLMIDYFWLRRRGKKRPPYKEPYREYRL